VFLKILTFGVIIEENEYTHALLIEFQIVMKSLMHFSCIEWNGMGYSVTNLESFLFVGHGGTHL
jgi:hypothetical protein